MPYKFYSIHENFTLIPFTGAVAKWVWRALGNVSLKIPPHPNLQKSRIYCATVSPAYKKTNYHSFYLSSILRKLLHWIKFIKSIFFLQCFYPHIGSIYDVQINDFDCFMIRAANKKIWQLYLGLLFTM